MYIINEIWNNIKSYIFHNIKLQGKHLKIHNSYIKNYNNVVKSVPTIVKPSTGPYVVYNAHSNSIRTAKLMYYNVQLRLSRSRPLFNTIIECVLLEQFMPKRLSFCPEYEGKSNILQYYYKNIQNVKSKLT
tara:strand:- start:545 stop:937 length:393 start_codon:yes stop_codon:yes gene_type:complete